MKNIEYLLGLPITVESTSKEFVDFLNSDEKTCLVSLGQFFFDGRDYTLGKVGFDVLMNSGFKVYSESGGKFFVPPMVRKSLLQINPQKNLSQETSFSIIEYIEEVLTSSNIDENVSVGLICQGSPNLYDSISFELKNLRPEIKIIDTKSSAEIIKDRLELEKEIHIHYFGSDEELKEDCLNIFGCFGEMYNSIRFPELIELLKPFDNFYQFFLGYPTEEKKRKIQKEQLFFELKQNPMFYSNSTLVAYND